LPFNFIMYVPPQLMSIQSTVSHGQLIVLEVIRWENHIMLQRLRDTQT